MNSTPIVYRLTGTMSSFYPGYNGAFISSITAPSVRTAKRLFKEMIDRQYPAHGIEAPLVRPIIRFDAVRPVADGIVWTLVKYPKKAAR